MSVRLGISGRGSNEAPARRLRPGLGNGNCQIWRCLIGAIVAPGKGGADHRGSGAFGSSAMVAFQWLAFRMWQLFGWRSLRRKRVVRRLGCRCGRRL